MQQRNANWAAGAVLIFFHVGALAAFWPGFFHWSALIVLAVLMYVTGGIGIALGFHRTLTHRSLRLWKPLEYVAVTCGTLALQGPPIDWVTTHRIHHAHTDTDLDPHDANAGFSWSHFLWMVMPNPNVVTGDQRRRYVPDLIDDPYYRFLDRYMIWLTVALAAVLFALGGMSWVVWGIFVRLALVYQFTWLVNSAAHTIGYRTFKTPDRSTNCWWVALLGWGEGWHNNHHAFPFSARHGLRWYELDVTWLMVKVLAFFRLATDLKLPTPQMIRRMRATAQSR